MIVTHLNEVSVSFSVNQLTQSINEFSVTQQKFVLPFIEVSIAKIIYRFCLRFDQNICALNGSAVEI